MIPAKVPAFSFHPTLLVAFPRRTEFRLKTPMRSEGHETRGLLSLVPAQNLFHRQGEVVIAKRFKYAAKISQGALVRFHKGLPTRMRKTTVESSATGRAARPDHVRL